MEDTELIEGLVFSQKTAGYGGPNKVEKAKIGLIQFCVSPPKTDMENQVMLQPCSQFVSYEISVVILYCACVHFVT